MIEELKKFDVTITAEERKFLLLVLFQKKGKALADSIYRKVTCALIHRPAKRPLPSVERLMRVDWRAMYKEVISEKIGYTQAAIRTRIPLVCFHAINQGWCEPSLDFVKAILHLWVIETGLNVDDAPVKTKDDNERVD